MPRYFRGVFVVAAFLNGIGEGRVVGRSFSTQGLAVDTAFASELHAIAAAEAEDRRFWSGMLGGLELQLVSLQEVAMQAAPETNATNSATAPTKPIKEGHHHSNALKGVKLKLNPKSVADLMPALEMLKAQYDDGKERITALNVQEKKNKQQFAEREAKHNATLARIEAQFKNGTLSAEFRTNETRDETRLWSYWARCRERQHRQFHTALKIQHSTMEREKQMIKMYDETISGTANKAQMVKQLAQVGGGMPEIVFLQTAWTEVSGFCSQALQELRGTRQFGESSVVVA